MRRLALISPILCVVLAAPVAAQTPPAPQTPAPQAPLADTSRSLFEVEPNQFLIGGRVSTVDGDPARFQRYQDYRDGLLFSGGRFLREDPKFTFNAMADNLGYRDQRYGATYNRTGKFTVSGVWDQIPQFYSVDTKTAYTTGGDGTLLLDDATQQKIQNGDPAKLNLYVPISPQFDLKETRDIGRFDFRATPTTLVDVFANFTTQRHNGELPWGASFGFSNDVEVPLPYDSRANDFTLGSEWNNSRNMLRVAYSGSWFDNLDDPLVWDSPLRLTDAVGSPSRGRMALWPSNSAQTVSFSGYTKMAHRTQLTGFLSYGIWSNDEPLQPFTINSALREVALPRQRTEGQANVLTTNLNLTSRPVTDWRFGARVRHYGYDNKTPATSITEYVTYDSDISTTPTGGPDLFAHSRTTFDADATYEGLAYVGLTAGFTHNSHGYDARIFESSGENVFRLSADAVGTNWLTFRALYEHGNRDGSGLDESALTSIHEQPKMRHYDVANRTRDRFTGQFDIVPNDMWSFSFSTGIGQDEYPDTVYGLQQHDVRTWSIGADFRNPQGFGAGITYNYEKYEGRQVSHEGDSSDAQFNDPLRDWTSDASEQVDYFSLYLTPPRFGKAEVRLSYDYSFAKANNVYTIPAGSPIPTPNQLPEVFNKLQQLRLEGRYRLSSRLAATVSYLYEPFRIYDYAFDPSVVTGIAQPSTLVMGYVYRPYTAHSTVFGIRFVW
jgi:MtrB/PioB family decaheme-associated outer membrane protein